MKDKNISARDENLRAVRKKLMKICQRLDELDEIPPHNRTKAQTEEYDSLTRLRDALNRIFQDFIITPP